MLSMTEETEYDETDGMVVVPDVIGLSIMDAAQRLEDNHLEMSIEGQGNATYQYPEEGEIVPEGTAVQVEFSESGG